MRPIEQARRLFVRTARARDERGAVGAHVGGDVGGGSPSRRTRSRTRAKRRRCKTSALNDHRVPQRLDIARPDDLVDGVAHHRIGQARRYVAQARPFFLGMTHARSHEHGAARSQVDGVLGVKRAFEEAVEADVHRPCHARQKSPATARAGLVEHDVLGHAVGKLHAFDILAADVEDEIDVGDELLRRADMAYRLDLARVERERAGEVVLAVAGDRGVGDRDGGGARMIARDVLVQIDEHIARLLHQVARRALVVRAQNAAVLGDERVFDGLRS